MHYLARGRFSVPLCALLISLLTSPAARAASSDAIVIGFLGGFVGHANAIHPEVQLATRLREQFPALQVKTFENHHGKQALAEVVGLLDADHDGQLSSQEKSAARIAIYGHSWGASQTVTLARSLAQLQIPVQLTVQVDSVEKRGQDDASIPANVSEAVNFFQLDGLLHGRSKIHAADASRTRILGNFQSDYRKHPVSLAGFPWFARLFMKPHIEIESDLAVWGRVESLICSELVLPPPPSR